jgi:hypothetical protein
MATRADKRFQLNEATYSAVAERAVASGQSPATVVAELLDQALSAQSFADQLRNLITAEFTPLREDIALVEQRSAELMQHFDAMLEQIGAGAKREKSAPVDWKKVVERGNKHFGIETP